MLKKDSNSLCQTLSSHQTDSKSQYGMRFMHCEYLNAQGMLISRSAQAMILFQLVSPFFCVLFFFECEQKEQRQRCNATNDDVGYLIIISTKEEFAREKVILKCDTLVNSKIQTSVMLHGIMTHYCDKQQESAFATYRYTLLYTGIEHPLSSIYVKGRNCPCVSVCLRV